MTCPKCGHVNEDKHRFCLMCGTPLHQQPAASRPGDGASNAGPLPAIVRAPTPQPQPRAQPQPRSQPIEPQLPRRSQPAQAQPAPAQAQPAPAQAQPAPAQAQPAPQPDTKSCPSCGGQVPWAHLFCGLCGHRFEPPEAAAPAPQPRREEPAPIPHTAQGVDVVRAHPRDSDPTLRDDLLAPPSPPARLVMMNPDGSEGGGVSLADGANVLGRDSEVPFLQDDEHLSPQHARIICDGPSVQIEDLGSVNGVFLQLGPEPVPLQHGDTLRIGQQLLRFEEVARQAPLLDHDHDPDTECLGCPSHGLWGTLHRVIASDGRAGTVYALGGSSITIGREHGDVVLRGDGFVSGQHARLRRDDHGAVLLEDLGSSNGTYLRLRRPHDARHGDYLLIGQRVFRVDVRGGSGGGEGGSARAGRA